MGIRVPAKYMGEFFFSKVYGYSPQKCSFLVYKITLKKWAQSINVKTQRIRSEVLYEIPKENTRKNTSNI